MYLESNPIGETYDWDESDITELNWLESGLKVVVSFWKRENSVERRHIEYFWKGHTIHRVLEESNLEHYWENGIYQKGVFLFEVLAGGWISNAKSERINIWCGREWFLYTSNMSATVISTNEPLITEL